MRVWIVEAGTVELPQRRQSRFITAQKPRGRRRSPATTSTSSGGSAPSSAIHPPVPASLKWSSKDIETCHGQKDSQTEKQTGPAFRLQRSYLSGEFGKERIDAAQLRGCLQIVITLPSPIMELLF